MKYFIEVEENLRLHITDVGDGKPVLLIHGWPESDEIFSDYYTLLADQGYRAIGITMRGFGQSDRATGTYDFNTFSKDILKVLQKLELKEVTLVGFSMGGAIATYLIANFAPKQVSRLVIVCANVPLAIQKDNYLLGPTAEMFDAVIELIATDREAITDVYGNLFQLTEDFMPRETGNWINKIGMEASVEATIRGIEELKDLDLRPDLNRIKIPTAIFHAINDNVVPFELAKMSNAGIPNSVLIEFSEGGHWILFKEKEKIMEELVKFIS